MRVVDGDGLHQADVVVAVEGRQGDRVDAFLQHAGVDRKCVGDIGLIGEVHFANGVAIEADGNAVRLLIGAALQGDVNGRGQCGIRVEMRDGELFVYRLAGDSVAEEVVLILAV